MARTWQGDAGQGWAIAWDGFCGACCSPLCVCVLCCSLSLPPPPPLLALPLSLFFCVCVCACVHALGCVHVLALTCVCPLCLLSPIPSGAEHQPAGYPASLATKHPAQQHKRKEAKARQNAKATAWHKAMHHQSIYRGDPKTWSVMDRNTPVTRGQTRIQANARQGMCRHAVVTGSTQLATSVAALAGSPLFGRCRSVTFACSSGGPLHSYGIK